jgi:hypothetical protein
MPPKPWLGDVVSDEAHAKAEKTIECPKFTCDYCGFGPQAGMWAKTDGTFEYLRCGVCKTVVYTRLPIEAVPAEGGEVDGVAVPKQ